jgi:galactokinase
MSKQTLDPARRQALIDGYRAAFFGTPSRFFSAPGRTEICGNHTDHQRGQVLAAAVDLDTLAAVGLNGTDEICIQSEGYPMCRVDLHQLSPDAGEFGTTLALIRGVAARFREMGCPVQGFNAYVTSQVLPGSGLSSSAAFEVLVGTILNGLFFENKATQPEIAQIAQYAENVFFGKPCGLMDQMASAVGNLVAIDFGDADHPVVQPLDFDFSQTGYALCIIDSRASHADLTDEYAAIPAECRAVAAELGREVLSQVPEAEFFAALPTLRKTCGDRAVLRAIHFYQENRRVSQAVKALEMKDFDRFLQVLKESGRSSYMYLQNVTPAGAVEAQDMAVTLALCEHYLDGTGAYRVHGGGFAGTAQAFVPMDRLEIFKNGINSVLGEGACHVLSIRPQGGVELEG